MTREMWHELFFNVPPQKLYDVHPNSHGVVRNDTQPSPRPFCRVLVPSCQHHAQTAAEQLAACLQPHSAVCACDERHPRLGKVHLCTTLQSCGFCITLLDRRSPHQSSPSVPRPGIIDFSAGLCVQLEKSMLSPSTPTDKAILASSVAAPAVLRRRHGQQVY
jgi:hypothetical protein